MCMPAAGVASVALQVVRLPPLYCTQHSGFPRFLVTSAHNEMAPSGTKSKYWIFTLNNYTPEDQEKLEEEEKGETFTYLVWGKEIGTSGTPHFQGYVEFKVRKRLSGCKRYLPTAHWEVRRGSPEQASAYCKKDGNYQETGVISKGQGHRADLADIQQKLNDNVPLVSIANDYFSQFIQYHRSFEKYVSLNSTKRNWVTEVYIYWGDANSGKTRKVFDMEGDLWIAPDNSLNWFDGYAGQESVLFDDFIQIPDKKLDMFLKLLDRYPMSVPVKGGFVNWAPKKIFFTSNIPWSGWTQNIALESMEAISRRLTAVKHFVLQTQ